AQEIIRDVIGAIKKYDLVNVVGLWESLQQSQFFGDDSAIDPEIVDSYIRQASFVKHFLHLDWDCISVTHAPAECQRTASDGDPPFPASSGCGQRSSQAQLVDDDIVPFPRSIKFQSILFNLASCAHEMGRPGASVDQCRHVFERRKPIGKMEGNSSRLDCR